MSMNKKAVIFTYWHDRKLGSLSSNQRLDFKLHKGFQSETVRTLRVTAFSPDRLNNLSSALFFWRQVTTHRAVESNSTLVTGMFPKYRLTVWPIEILYKSLLLIFVKKNFKPRDNSVCTKLTNTSLFLYQIEP